MNVALQRIADILLQLVANYYTPQFHSLWHESCDRTTRVIFANQGAKVAAALPPIVLSGPNSLTPTLRVNQYEAIITIAHYFNLRTEG